VLLRIAIDQRRAGDGPAPVRLDRAALGIEIHARRQLAARDDLSGVAIHVRGAHIA